jgi:hypothetical protein
MSSGFSIRTLFVLGVQIELVVMTICVNFLPMV